VLAHCVRARREFAPAGDPLSLLVQRKGAKKAPQNPLGCLPEMAAACSMTLPRPELAARRLRQARPVCRAPQGSPHRFGYHRSTSKRQPHPSAVAGPRSSQVEQSTPPAARRLGPARPVYGAQRGSPHQFGNHRSTSKRHPNPSAVAGRCSSQVERSTPLGRGRWRSSTQRPRLFEPPGGEFGMGRGPGAGSRPGGQTTKWVFRCFLCTSKERGSPAGANSRRALTQ
jgi:hypothetical protein